MSFRDDASERRAFALPGSTYQYGPDKIVAVEHIDLHLVPDLAAQSLEGVCTTTMRALDEQVSHVRLDAVDLVIERVERDGKAQPFAVHGDHLDVTFEPPLEPGARAALAIAYRVVKPRYGLFFIEPTPAHPEKVRHAWTQSQDTNARFWFPCIDHPAYKQTSSTEIVVPQGTFALGNGALVERRDANGTTTFRYRQDVPHSTYLMTLVVGPFVEVVQRAAGRDKTPVSYYVLPGREADGERAFGNTPRMIECFEERTGAAYPYARYSQIAVTDFIFGGMENTSATTQTDRTLHDAVAHLDFSSDFLVSHELAHQWFGDLLTCRDWSHAWLNEGFATFFEAVWREADLGRDEYLYDVFSAVAQYLEEDGDRYRRPIVCNHYRDPIEIFDRHLYQKGAAVLHMLRSKLGEARFWRSIRHYVERNAQRNVETIDLIRAIEEATGRNLRGFFEQWVLRGGHPEVEVSYAWDAKAKTATVAVEQKQRVDAEHPAFAFDVDVCVDGRSFALHVERARATVAIPLEARPALICFDPGASLLASVKYKLGAEASAAVLRDDPDVVGRIRAARELAKDGSRAAREALQNAFEKEQFWGVLAETAAAIGATRAPWAQAMLLGALGHAHPKVRRAVAAALGNFRSVEVATALMPLARGDASYFVRADALTALGKTRDDRAFDVLARAAQEKTWNETVESGAVRGLAELRDPRALDIVQAMADARCGEGVRRAAAGAIGRIGALMEAQRTQAVAALEPLLDDPQFLVQLAAIAATETLGDARLLPTLGRLAHSATDGRTRRDADEAALRIRESAKVPAQVSAMRDQIDELREEQRKLQEKIETLARH